MDQRIQLISVLIIALLLPGCISGGPVDEDHPFSGEWTTQQGLLMIFFETDTLCSTEWNVFNNTTENIVDCMDATGMRTTQTYNHTFVGNVLFMQPIHIQIEYSDGNTSSADMSEAMVCAAYVPRDIAADEATWEAEVNAVTLPSYCETIVGIDT